MTDEPGFFTELGENLVGAGAVARSASAGALQAISYLAVPILCVGLVAGITIFLVKLPGKVMNNG
jgi:hypothetical protein